jgi:hypothetical protein
MAELTTPAETATNSCCATEQRNMDTETPPPSRRKAAL